jgi:hypothetical protein
LLLLAISSPAHAERLRSAFDPLLHIRPPTMKTIGGGSAALMFDADFAAAAARYRAQHPAVLAAGVVSQSGEVVLIQADDEIATFDGAGYGLVPDGLAVVARRLIEHSGDSYHAITVWMTFDDRMSPNAEAYEVPVKNDVEGLGRQMTVRDNSGLFGSRGVLRSVLNMKTVALRAGETMQSWTPSLETWGQESAHRWMVFMLFRDPRTGRSSDALLGRDCAHYSRYVDTQASVQDGFAWQDNGDGTFTWTETAKRYSNLDLYGMGLLAADEVPPFFLIDNIPGYVYPASCIQYGSTVRLPQRTVSGQRVDITIDDIIAANGERKAPADQRQDYWREAEVILMAPNETPDSPRVTALAARINRARAFWEQWSRTASRNRLVICTQVTADCGDPRSDIGTVTLNAAQKAPASGPLLLDVNVSNPGGRAATGVTATVDVTVAPDDVRHDVADVGTVEAGASKTVSFPVDLRTIPCGTEVAVNAAAQSDFHFHRGKSTHLLGVADRYTDGFESESGWSADPDGDDTQSGARWERGRPQATELLRKQVQLGAAHAGVGAWVTGLASTSPTTRAALVRDGKATLQSPLYDTEGLREPRLRYWLSFAGLHADPTGQGLEPSPQSRLVVQARAVDMPAMGPAIRGDWVDVDAIDNAIAVDWVQRSAVLPSAVMGKNRIQLRFVASDGNAEQGGVEVAIDDLAITSNLASCYLPPPVPLASQGGGGCAIGGRVSGAGSALCLLALAIAVRRRRRYASSVSSSAASPDRSRAR